MKSATRSLRARCKAAALSPRVYFTVGAWMVLYTLYHFVDEIVIYFK
jgi:hypothetical protein